MNPCYLSLEILCILLYGLKISFLLLACLTSLVLQMWCRDRSLASVLTHVLLYDGHYVRG